MKKYNTAILNLIAKLKVQNPQFVDKSGLGYCANASMVLKEELSKIGIESKLLYGKYLKDNKAGQVAKAHFSNLIKHFAISNTFHGRVKSNFVKNGNKISDKGGHVALLVDECVYDVTSAQFGLPINYDIDTFLNMWEDVHVVDITLKPQKTAWTQKILYSYQSKNKEGVAMEGINTSIGFEDAGLDDLDKSEFMKWFSIQSKQVQQNSKIVSSEELGQDYMLHIDKNTPSKFIPMMPRSAADSENNTTPRITVAPTLLGCLIGYMRCQYDFRWGFPSKPKEKDKYRGGYEICALPFKHCIKPNNELVFHASQSGEHWLVTYNKLTIQYTPTKIGKVFISKIEYIAVVDKEPTAIYEIYVEIHKEDGVMLTPKIRLDKGFHKVTYTVENSIENIDNEKNVSVTTVSSGEYNERKQLSAAMLSMESNNKPKYLNW